LHTGVGHHVNCLLLWYDLKQSWTI